MKPNKDIIVLTGAGQIGMAIARRMGHGKKIFVADWKLENAKTITKIMEEAGFDVVPFEVDISSKASVLQLIAAAQKEGEISMYQQARHLLSKY
jgi:NADP-dependent 3-hydroxy acid dehydrogenase YdfG